ncbi:hypothetical protein JI59_06875 [Novosphingobium pentaromativorans US6-1]|nr:hypothetical protein JI59_06875 [Novosphingobium pentaromativorans US6-1]
MRGLNGTHTRITLALLLAGTPVIGHAQPVGSWSLPEPDSASSAPAPQGPVDAQHPILRPETGETAPSAKPAASPTPAPLVTAPPPPPAEPTARAAAKPATPKTTTPSRPSPSQRPAAQVPAPEPTASESAVPVEPSAQPEHPPAPQTIEPEAFGAEPPSWPAWWWALPAGIAAIALALFLLRRRRPQDLEWEETGETTAEAQPESPPAAPPLDAAPTPDSAPRRPLPEPAFTPAPRKPVVPPRPAPAAGSPAQIGVDLEPVAMRLSLFYATLQYRLTLTAEEARGPVTVSGDMISAHASLSQDQQLAPQVQDMARLHELRGLEAGGTAQLKGEIQLPLAEIRAMRQGGAALFVPLVRLCLTGADGLALRRVFTLGIPGSGTGLSPLRTDTGPRTFEPLAAREIEAARQIPLQTGTLPLDPQRAAG